MNEPNDYDDFATQIQSDELIPDHFDDDGEYAEWEPPYSYDDDGYYSDFPF